jgi:response regulator RpfG family c-di-GMP phosphodiesterase
MGKRRSLVKQMITLVVLLLCTLAIMMSMVAFKDIHWLERALIQVTNGYIDARLPVAQNDELGAMARMTNQMLDSSQDSQDEVKTTRGVAIVSLAALAESRDNETGAHILRTQEYVKALAIHLSGHPKLQEQLTPSYIDLLYKSAPLHDVGKVGIPDSVILKPGKLTDEEFEIVKGHPQIGADALSISEKRMGSSSFLRVAREIALTHHEKWDGTGYPNSLYP